MIIEDCDDDDSDDELKNSDDVSCSNKEIRGHHDKASSSSSQISNPKPSQTINKECCKCTNHVEKPHEVKKKVYVARQSIEDKRAYFKCGKVGHIATYCLQPKHEKRVFVDQRRCFRCNMKGHVVRDCPSKSKENPKESTPHLTTREPRRKLSKGQKDKLRQKRKKER